MRNRTIVDVVNFNADASCLSSKKWLDILNGSSNSILMRWLNLYVLQGKKIVLGFTGASLADIKEFNPESIELINRNPNIFEIILRPFSHDIALMRLGKGFLINFEYGRQIIRNEFHNLCNYFLPPEFMLTNEQITLLQRNNVDGIFINSARFSSEIQNRIPFSPYKIRGLFDSSINCIPIIGELTNHYLHALQEYDCSLWNDKILATQNDILFLWRDGESSFLLPNGLDREEYWLQNEAKSFVRSHINNLTLEFTPSHLLDDDQFTSYPVHSFSAWMKEFRMVGYLNRINAIEGRLEHMTEQQIQYWLMIINSDILSAIEKGSPIVHLKRQPNDLNICNYTIQRSDRGFEGEEYLVMLEHALTNNAVPEYGYKSELPHLKKWRARTGNLSRMGTLIKHATGR